jgi:hypothetical protein
LEELMMMEAIRLSLAAEEDRKKREEKDAAKEAKKDTKKKAKELKKVAKAQSRVGSGFHPIEIDGIEESEAGSSSAAGKGKEVDRAGGAGFNPMSEPTSTINTTPMKDDAQRYLEDSRAQIRRKTSSNNMGPLETVDEGASHRSALRNLSHSNASSSASSFAESFENSLRHPGQDNLAPGSSIEPSPSGSNINLSTNDTPQGTPGTEPMFNFQSLADTITPEERNEKDSGPQFIENVGSKEPSSKETSSGGPLLQATSESASSDKPGLEDSTMTLKPAPAQATNHSNDDEDVIEPAPRIEAVQNGHSHFDQKHMGEVSMMDSLHHQATQ